MNTNELIVVCGGGGFIGGHLVGDLLHNGHTRVRSVDIKPIEDWYHAFPEADNVQLNLYQLEACHRAIAGAAVVYNFAAEMGGMGFIEKNKALCMLNVLINTHLLEAMRQQGGVRRYFFASSACVYNGAKQQSSPATPLRESDAYPAMPEDGYGWEKLFSERMCRHFLEDFAIPIRVARYHNVYGPFGPYDGGREKAPAAICRKVIQAKLSGNHVIDIWGSGEQTRSFMYISDCLQGTQKLMHSDVTEPLNVGSEELVSINQLVDIVEEIASVKLRRRYLPDAPSGVNGRNSDNTLIKELLHWQPEVKLHEGMEKTYRWIYDQLVNR
ncbi:MAG TPA: NAD-dependent epimerase/dehydratase family protein [Gemmataceae bacterium]|nr:NAD-dependent epimerase/dehydratase family protein [Gemmataceae bacterium]